MISLTFTPGRNDDLISRLPGGKIVLIERGARLPAGFGAGVPWLCEIREPVGGKVAFARPIRMDPEPARKAAEEAARREAYEESGRAMSAMRARALRGEVPSPAEVADESGDRRWRASLAMDDTRPTVLLRWIADHETHGGADFRVPVAAAAAAGHVRLLPYSCGGGASVGCAPWYLDFFGGRATVPLAGGLGLDLDAVRAVVAQLPAGMREDALARMEEIRAGRPSPAEEGGAMAAACKIHAADREALEWAAYEASPEGRARRATLAPRGAFLEALAQTARLNGDWHWQEAVTSPNARAAMRDADWIRQREGFVATHRCGHTEYMDVGGLHFRVMAIPWGAPPPDGFVEPAPLTTIHIPEVGTAPAGCRWVRSANMFLAPPRPYPPQWYGEPERAAFYEALL
ncbi:MAG TPA: hypothetical protein PLA94_17690, partial [Myxococcota bacterium]|nr:hypothetical protein [Myxococcota bacterium]